MTKSVNEIWQELSELTKEELHKASLERRPTKKNPKGFYTQRAKIAQLMIWKDADCPFQSSYHWFRDHTPVHKI